MIGKSDNTVLKTDKICLLGFGEVGQILYADLSAAGYRNICVWDILFPDAESAPSLAAKAANLNMATGTKEAVSEATVIIAAITAEGTAAAAQECATNVASNAWYLDLNSASPNAKINAAEAIAAAGGKYVEAAVMSPVSPKRMATPILLGGTHAEAFLTVANSMGLSGVRFYSPEFGKASAAKMCRSILVKGVESLLTESLLTARNFGVEETVISSLDDLFPGPDWPSLSAYMISRSLQHGKRRAEEMREAAKTVEEVGGVMPLMSTACAERQQLAAQYNAKQFDMDLEPLLDFLLAKTRSKEDGPC